MDGQRPSYSLRKRLLLWLLLPLGLIALLALIDSYSNARQTANEAADRVLAGSVLAISERVFINDYGELEVDIPYVALDMLTSAAQDRVFYRIDGSENEFVTGYHKLPVPDLPQSTLQLGRVDFTDGVYRRDKVRIAILHGSASTGLRSIPYRVSVAETVIARNQLTREILIRSALRQLVLVLSAGIIVWFGVTRALKPLNKLEAAIGRRSPDDMRPILHHVPQEVEGLVVRINNFMERLSGALEALKNFTGNAGHQIRTPLTIIRTQLAVAHRAGDADERELAFTKCDSAIQNAERTLSQLMLLARIDEAGSKAVQNSVLDLADLAQKVSADYVVPARKAGFDLGYEGPDHLTCRGEAVLVTELLKNLIDNALRHAEGGDEITVRVLSRDAYAQLEIIDNGTGIPQSARSLSERFKTGHDRNSGSGLGLAIVAEIAMLFGGNMAIPSPPHADQHIVRISLPLADDA